MRLELVPVCEMYSHIDEYKQSLETINEKIKTLSMSIDRKHDDIEALVGIIEKFAKVRDQE